MGKSIREAQLIRKIPTFHPGQHRLGFDGEWSAYNFHHLYFDAYYYKDSPEKIVLPGYEPDGQTDLAIDYLQRASTTDDPFALFLSIGTPHDPWTQDNVPAADYEMFQDIDFPLPPNYRDENDPYGDTWAIMSPAERAKLPEWMRVYYAMTANLDRNIGRLLRAVDDLGLRDDTIFVFTSDHGEMFGAQGRRAKNIFYEEAVRVPFLVRWQGSNSGRTCLGCVPEHTGHHANAAIHAKSTDSRRR